MKAGDTVTLQTLEGTLSPLGMIPRTKSLRVAGTFSLGLYEIDSTFGFVTLDRAKRLLDVDDVQLIQLRIDDIYKARTCAPRSSASRRGISTDWTRKTDLITRFGLRVAVGPSGSSSWRRLNIVATPTLP